MTTPPTLTVLSLGGGVQSTVMALMASQGAFDRVPDCAIFADTRWEPPSVYDHISWLKDRMRLPPVRRGQRTQPPRGREGPHQPLGPPQLRGHPRLPQGRNGEGDGIGRRQCTENYKVIPIRRRIREMLGMKPRQRVPSGVNVEMWLGISIDEAIRMKTSRDRWVKNRYPLIEAGMTRQDCMGWWNARYDRPLERSACVACPFQSRHRWVETKRRWPELFAEAVEIDARLRSGLALDKTPYLHRQRRPLAEARVKTDERDLGAAGQADGFGNECEGHCGV